MEARKNSTHLLVMGLAGVLVLVAGAPRVFGQLTAADVAALRAQGKQEGWTFSLAESSATARALYEVALTGAELGPGTHDYYFDFEDGCGAGASLPANGQWQFTVVPPCDPEELASLFAPDYLASANFGWSVALDGDTAVVGAPVDDPNGLVDAGSAYVFVRSSDVWRCQAKLTAPDAQAGARFGWSVALKCDTAVIGAPYADPGGQVDAGAAYVFVRSAGVWTVQTELVADDGAAGDWFGRSVAVDGDTAVIGAYGADPLGKTDAGAAYAFVRSNGLWKQQAKLIAADDGESGDYFGCSVALQGDTVAVGSYYDDWREGSVYVFTRSGVAWTQRAKLKASDPMDYAYFGTALAIDGNVLVVGADGVWLDERSGAAYVFRGGGPSWTWEAQLKPPDGAYLDNFGISVAVSGNLAIVGAFRDDRGTDVGAAYVFRHQGEDWAEQAGLTASDGESYAYFGFSVALGGNTALIGAYGKDLPGAADAGSAYVFDLGCIRLGDLNCDRTVDVHDINPFVLALSDPEGYAQQYPYCDIMLGDINADGTFDFGDINPFVALLSGGG